MKPSLQLKFSQQLTMTPQLQQAIKLLQLSTLDLQQEIQEALDANPLLEVEDTFNEKTESLDTGSTDTTVASTDEASGDNMTSSDALESNNVSDELPLDSTWDE